MSGPFAEFLHEYCTAAEYSAPAPRLSNVVAVLDALVVDGAGVGLAELIFPAGFDVLFFGLNAPATLLPMSTTATTAEIATFVFLGQGFNQTKTRPTGKQKKSDRAITHVFRHHDSIPSRFAARSTAGRLQSAVGAVGAAGAVGPVEAGSVTGGGTVPGGAKGTPSASPAATPLSATDAVQSVPFQ